MLQGAALQLMYRVSETVHDLIVKIPSRQGETSMKRRMIKRLRQLNPAMPHSVLGGSGHRATSCWGRPFTRMPTVPANPFPRC
jgi:hypothetical protein